MSEPSYRLRDNLLDCTLHANILRSVQDALLLTRCRDRSGW